MKGRKLRREDAVPTIPAFLLDPESAVEQDFFFKYRPLYSSPAFRDHNYANFVAVVLDCVEFESDEDHPEIGESSKANGCTAAAEIERNLLAEEASWEKLREISAVGDTEPSSGIERNLFGEEATYEKLQKFGAVADTGTTSDIAEI